jgi:hypothetical protein
MAQARSDPEFVQVQPGVTYGPYPSRPSAQPDFRQLLRDLLELDLHDALGGVAAVIAERARQVRSADPSPYLTHRLVRAAEDLQPGGYAIAGALLCAAIDRQWPTGTEARS